MSVYVLTQICMPIFECLDHMHHRVAQSYQLTAVMLKKLIYSSILCLVGELRKASSSIDTSTWSTLKGINDLVHQVFPPMNNTESEDLQEREEFNDYNFWHKHPAIIVESGMFLVIWHCSELDTFIDLTALS
jgi:hypothetical protein